MSIFHVTDISEKPSSYTSQLANKDINYQALRSEVRTSIIDKYNHFEKLGQKPKSPKGGQQSKESPRKHQNTLRTLDILFGKPPQNQEQVSQSSPAKISGLKKKMQQIGTQEQTGKFHLSTGAQDFKSTYYDQSGAKHSFLSPQSRNTQDGLMRSGSLTSKFYPERGTQLSNAVPIQRLVEIQNLLELTPSSELQTLPRNYLDELQRVASSIQRNLKHHNDIRLKQ
ncbi:unnamed protein product (macronuclear) [Paramecium tetraurelia]|uniref:Uncharacterized protein n=1 Tax=Paramecium tetraurelia TaxID=5888 RepID=A0BDA0_PARTE|nr:uncharacterized protein GSPATT00004611001 [Paramecium tetraurelia]CAK56517.1 unnamed protein product [Paramecium tetraurelia]|eukprot:XP_001423915.1 hypothetical protein (macronuclear) [Paramecium tetraurelia strain d4-2]